MDLAEAIEEFCRIDCGIYNQFFFGAFDESRLDAYRAVETSLFQILVLERLNLTGAYGDEIDGIECWPNAGAVVALQDTGQDVALSPNDRLVFDEFLDGADDRKTCRYGLGTLRVAGDPGLVGREVAFSVTDVTFRLAASEAGS